MSERERIELLMKCFELSPSQFADRTGIQRASVSHIISGRNKPSLEVMQKISEAFPSVDIRWLMTGNGEEPIAGASKEIAGANVVENTLFPAQTLKPVPEAQTAVPRVPAVNEPEPVRQPRRQSSTVHQQAERSPRKTVLQRMQQVHSNEKRIKEIRVYYTDGTYEILFPEK